MIKTFEQFTESLNERSIMDTGGIYDVISPIQREKLNSFIKKYKGTLDTTTHSTLKFSTKDDFDNARRNIPAFLVKSITDFDNSNYSIIFEL